MLQLLTRSRSIVWTGLILLVLGVVTFGVVVHRVSQATRPGGARKSGVCDWRLEPCSRSGTDAAEGGTQLIPRRCGCWLARSARLGRDSSANALFEKLGSAALQSEDLYLLGLGLNRSGQAAQAERVWERALALDAHHPELLEQLALLYTARNRLAEAAFLADRLSTQPGWQLRGRTAAGLASI